MPPSSRIDTHQHFWRYDPADYGWIDDRMHAIRRDFLPADVLPEMQRAGFDASIAVQARQSLEETEALLDLGDRHSWIAGVVGWTDLQADDAPGVLERLASRRKLVGVRHVVQDEPDERFLLRPAFCRGIRCLEPLGLTYDILVYARQLPVVADFVARFPAQRFVLDHLAKPRIRAGELDDWARDLAAVAAHPNVLAKLSGLTTEASWDDWTPDDLRPYLDVAVDLFGSSRLMVGSDWPVSTLAGHYGSTMRVFTDYLASWDPDRRAAVLGGNAERFWRLAAPRSEREESGDDE